MKFMKLGSRPDTFFTTEAIRTVPSEVSSDLTIQVQGNRYLLHKFPLLSKSLRLQKLCSENPEASIIQLPDFPGGIESFELCAKFCYGMTVTLNAYNIVSMRCAAEYFQMTEDVEKGNLIYKLEVFFKSCILNGWKDTIVTLQSTKAFSFCSEDLGITKQCIEAIASKVLAHPSKVSLSQSNSRRSKDDLSCNGSEVSKPSKGWWADDLAELGIDIYWRTIIAIKSGGKIPVNVIGDALRIYASRWLSNIQRYMNMEKQVESINDPIPKDRLLLESIVSLLPSEKSSVPCSFLLKLLKAANILKASSSTQNELARRIGLQLEEASVSDLLIPCLASNEESIYDIDVVMTILQHFMIQRKSPQTSPIRVKGDLKRRRSRSEENIDSMFQESRRSSSVSHGSKIKVAKLVDGYLQEIAKDKNLPLSKFVDIAESVPEFSRIDHDDLYKAIDIYLKEHPELNKNERKRLCRVLDCKKLSIETCMHAAQNDMLPLRVIIQVLFFEQTRSSKASGQLTELTSNIKALIAANKTPSKCLLDEQWSVSGMNSDISTLKMKLDEDHDEVDNNFVENSGKVKSFCMISNRPKKMFSKFWPIRHQQNCI